MISSQFVSRVTLKKDEVESFERYPFCLPAVRSLEALELHPKVTFVVGENGTGKSTLLEAIAVSLGFNAEGGTKNFHFDTRRLLRIEYEATQPILIYSTPTRSPVVPTK